MPRIQEVLILGIENLVHGDYQFLIDYYGEEFLQKRYDTIKKDLEEYISINGLENKVIISEPLLCNLVIDYFVDIFRLKNFQGIELVNDQKIYAYTAYWMLRRKPLQLIEPDSANDLGFVNEEMVVSYLYSYLYLEPKGVSIVSSKTDDFNEFENNLLYTFMYRDYSPKMIESLIYAFNAGRAYQYSVDFGK